MRTAVPLILIALATLAAAVMAYGTHPGWIRFAHGLGLIMLSKRLEWPLAAIAVILCLVLLGLAIAGKRSVWWLIGLLPVLALFMHRFATGPMNRFSVLDSPTFAAAEDAKFLRDDDSVVGVVFEDVAYAYPYAALYAAPTIVQNDHDKRMLLMWSPLANRAVAVLVDRDLKARDLEIVSMPAGAVLIYNSRLGQFINSITARTPGGQNPSGFRGELSTAKTTWKSWLERHPQTRVLAPSDRVIFREAPQVPADQRIVLVAATQPVAVLASDVKDVVNVSAGQERIVLIRDASGVLRAFDRRLEPDLAPQFALNHDPKRHGYLVDGETNTLWSAGGVALESDYVAKGRKLRPLDVDEDLNFAAMKFWYPDLQLAKPMPITFAAPATAHVAPAKRPAYHRR